MTVVVKVPTGMTAATVVVLVVTIIALVGHHLHPGVVIIAGGRIRTTVSVVVVIMTPSTENGHARQTHTRGTDMMHTGAGARAPTVAPAKEAITLTYLAATETTCPTFRSS